MLSFSLTRPQAAGRPAASLIETPIASRMGHPRPRQDRSNFRQAVSHDRSPVIFEEQGRHEQAAELSPSRNATEDALNDNNVLKFEPRKPKQENKPAAPGPKKRLLWLAVAAVIVLAWAYYQFIAPQAL